MAECKFCGAEVSVGDKCDYCGRVAESFYYSTKKVSHSTNEIKRVAKGFYYPVKKGDTLYGISKKFYGIGSLYNKIYEANTDKIKNPNLIYAGMMLYIPE